MKQKISMQELLQFEKLKFVLLSLKFIKYML